MRYKSQASRRSGINNKMGKQGEKLAINRLKSIGVLMPQEIATPFVILQRKDGGWMRGFWKKKVIGDIYGHTENGISVLAEVKNISDRNLRWSDFKSHQPPFLSQHAEKAISLLVWVRDSGVYIMYWQDVLSMGFRPGKGLTEKQAKKISIERL